MQTGTQLCVPEGFDVLRKGVVYHLLRSDAVRERVLLLEFRSKTIKRKGKTRVQDTGSASSGGTLSDPLASVVTTGSPDAFRPVLHYLSRHRFEQGLDDGMIVPCELQEELPPWFTGLSVDELCRYAQPRAGRKRLFTIFRRS